MKNDLASSVVPVEGMGKTVTYGIKGDGLGHIFNILRNQLYTDKVAAVIREYSCNAVDANVENGKKSVPIKVTLPSTGKEGPPYNSTRKDYFIVRDYGKGLTQNQIENIFCYYGESTKNNSNAYIGQLGIGSKSAFCYTDSYQIVSYCSGTRTEYLSYIDDTQLGVISVASVQPTTEPDGLEIRIPVKQNDAGSFVSKALQLYNYFDVMPNITNSNVALLREQHETITSSSLVHKCADFTLYQSYNVKAHFDATSHIMARMGNIAYPIPTIHETVAKFFERSLCNDTLLILNFKIGELSISANREGLEFNDRTKAAITTKIETVKLELGKLMDSKLAGARDLLEAIHATYGAGLALKKARAGAIYKFVKGSKDYRLDEYCSYYGEYLSLKDVDKETNLNFPRDYALWASSNYIRNGKVEESTDRDLNLCKYVSTGYSRDIHCSLSNHRYLVDIDIKSDATGGLSTKSKRIILAYARGILNETKAIDKKPSYLYLVKLGPNADAHLIRDGFDPDLFTKISTFAPIAYKGDPVLLAGKQKRNTSKVISDLHMAKLSVKDIDEWIGRQFPDIVDDSAKQRYEEHRPCAIQNKTLDLKAAKGYFIASKAYGYNPNVRETPIFTKIVADSGLIDKDSVIYDIPLKLYNRYKTSIQKYLKDQKQMIDCYVNILADAGLRQKLDCFLAKESSQSVPCINLVRAYPTVFAKDTEIVNGIADIDAKADQFLELIIGKGNTKPVTVVTDIAHMVRVNIDCLSAILHKDTTSDPKTAELIGYIMNLRSYKYPYVQDLVAKFNTKYKGVNALLSTQALIKESYDTCFRWAKSDFKESIQAVLTELVDGRLKLEA